MTFEVVPLVDGDVLLVAAGEFGGAGQQDGQPRAATGDGETGLLDAVEVAQVLGEAIAGGLTFEALKVLARRVSMRRTGPLVVADVTQVREAVVDYLTSSGYGVVRLTESSQIAGQGWTLEGKADSRRFTALADESGQIVHVRVR